MSKLKDLLQGNIEFQESFFSEYKGLFQTLGQGQQPHTLFIGCSDSRVVPNLITNTMPGELFTIRNIANVVPPYRTSDEFLATTSAIEYALQVLDIQNIVVCGHSHCGGCQALYYPEETFKHMPNVYRWLELLKDVKTKVLSLHPCSDIKRLWLTEQINVRQQLENLLTYPTVQERLDNNTLQIQGWYYVIQSGKIFFYDFEQETFTLFKQETGESS